MLQRLHIRNYAIIDELEIEFERGLNIITGETGAGKSILMGALGLVLGNRADTSVLFEAGEKCFVEAVFSTTGHKELKKLLSELELDEEESLVLRREIAPSGKSRSFVNDTPVTLQDLKRIASLMVDLHRQFDTLSLSEDRFQFDVLDALAGHADTVKSYSEAYQNWRRAEAEYRKLKEQQENGSREMDYTRFLFSELEEALLQPNELEELASEVKLLSNAGDVKTALTQVSYALEESDPSIVQQLKHLANTLNHTGAQLPGLTELSDRLISVQIELQDIAHELSRLNDRISLDPERLEVANERLSMGYRLLKKHGLQTTTELIALQESLGEKLLGFDNLDERLGQKKDEAELALVRASNLAQKLSAGRKKVTSALEKTTNTYLGQMGMPNARMLADCKALPAENGQTMLNAQGCDEVDFMFDANKTGRFESIGKVASGGELSRLMLAIKAQVAKSVQLPALIFDEIDSGISGEAARQVGLLLRSLASEHQVISITHQPQIAAKAHAHYFVYKQDNDGTVRTRMRRLDKMQRVEAIARMLSGEALTETARKIALEMVENP